MLSVLLNEVAVKWFKKTAQSFVFLPYFISWLVVSMMVQTMFSSSEGMVNQALTSLGFKGVDYQVETTSVWLASSCYDCCLTQSPVTSRKNLRFFAGGGFFFISPSQSCPLKR
ncbi:hypothetical protein [Paenibacillus azoreducens]|uniref:hypothetical protein n=1 Tax=Paenibacillus azoreducens TaxID=116718 RepID=UPI001BB4394F|nr:hypothetical protein [Paenibacillus azoreducens]